MRSNCSIRCFSSVWLDLRKRLRAGTLKKTFRTIKLLPTGAATLRTFTTSEPLRVSWVAISSSARLVVSSTCATEAIEARASPRNPIERREKRSWTSEILLVAWRSKAMRASIWDIPQPSSVTLRLAFPASSTSTIIRFAPASREFSTSSFRIDAGRWITSPAAIWLAILSGSTCIISLIVYNRGTIPILPIREVRAGSLVFHLFYLYPISLSLLAD